LVIKRKRAPAANAHGGKRPSRPKAAEDKHVDSIKSARRTHSVAKEERDESY